MSDQRLKVSHLQERNAGSSNISLARLQYFELSDSRIMKAPFKFQPLANTYVKETIKLTSILSEAQVKISGNMSVYQYIGVET